MEVRLTQPKNNKYYMRKVSGGYSSAIVGSPKISTADVLCNCVGYAGSRFNEIIGKKKEVYQLVCNAENFIEAAKKQGLKISDTPIQGGIMVWQRGKTLGGGDGAGHVAVVEEIYNDGTILTSESGYNAWAFKTIRRDNSNGRWGQNSAYKFRGCIVNPAVTDPKVVPTPKLTVDGVAGNSTIRALQKYLGSPQDGVLSGQSKSLSKYYPGIIAVEYGKGGSACVKKLQKWVGVTQDGIWGQGTSKALQKKFGVTTDGIFGKASVKALQKFLNDKLYAENKEPTGPPSIIEAPVQQPTNPPAPVETPTADKYKVIDVSVWQGKIDWAKVKADGVVGAIIRYADGTMLDSKFDENMKNAKANGIHVGSYIFSRAKTKAEAEKEAERIFNACKPYNLDMPMYIDLEVSANAKYANTVAQSFLNKMAKLGGRGGVYANLNWWNNYLADTAKNYSASPFWIAQYYDKITHKNPKLFGMWQYSSSGKVNGISGKVDMDWCYVEYWKNSTPPTDDTPTEPPKPTKTIEELAQEVLDGKWGSGDERKKRLTDAGYDYEAVQKRVNEIIAERTANKEKAVLNGDEWCRKIASDNRYHYMKWSSSDKQTHLCPICTNVNFNTDPKHFGWNCIGAAWAVWHHGMGLPCKCNCHVISDEVGEQIYKAKTDAEALKIAQDHIGMKDIIVLRNGNKNIPHSKWQAGDICLKFSGDTYAHAYFYMGDGYIFEATGSNGKVPNDSQVRINKWDKYTAKVIIRWTGEGKVGSKYEGEMPTLAIKKTNKEVKADAIRWATWIAGDNRFHYGYTNKHNSSNPKKWNPNAHHNGCYFCGTNTTSGGRSKAGITDYQFTYCCNPFVGAAWAHGGGIPKAMELCQKGSSWNFEKGTGYDASSLFDNLGKPAKSALQAGDVLCSDSHVALYIGNGKVAEAASGDDNVKNSTKWNNSIHTTSLTDSKYGKFKRVHRYNSSVNTTSLIRYGEVSKRVELLQKFLVWYGIELTADGIFGDKTLTAVKKFQQDMGIAVDGIVGNDTIAKMQEVRK